ncbi:MAG: proprotein convertase P-domain-containing protein, partial [Parvularculaceae bacterium]
MRRQKASFVLGDHMKSFVVAIPAALSMFGAAAAATVNFDYAGAPVQVDGLFTDVGFNVVASPGATIDGMTVTLDFTKCDDPINAAGDCLGAGFSFNNEIQFILTSPDATSVTLIAAGAYSGQTPGDRVVVTFDDAAASAVGGALLADGTFRPTGLLSAFIGEIVSGLWTLRVQDTVGADPLQLNDFQVAFE